ncbi:MAG: sulfur carrier protein ThiS [Phycisphaerales bacterium JB063]
MPTITLNGQPHTTDAATVADLLQEQGLAGQAVAVELNQSVVPKREHADQPLHEGDQIELVTLVGGG